MDENSALWNAAFAADMVARLQQVANERGWGEALSRLIQENGEFCQDSECVADEIVKAFTSYKKGK